MSKRGHVNHWPLAACAKAFWGQQHLPPYRRLLADTVSRLEPRAGERWLDLGCGGGQLSRAIWTKSAGSVREVVGFDVAPLNSKAYAEARRMLMPRPHEMQYHFVAGDFSHGLARWPDGYFDGIVSGLSIQYAESFCETMERWTRDAYDNVLREVARLLRPGGRFVFSVNIPNPSWGRIAVSSVLGFFVSRRPDLYLLNAWRMYRYGAWLKRQAAAGRFHYLPIETVLERLQVAGFGAADYAMSFSRQAYVIRAHTPAVSVQAAA